jgi:hypothetical protein
VRVAAGVAVYTGWPAGRGGAGEGRTVGIGVEEVEESGEGEKRWRVSRGVSSRKKEASSPENLSSSLMNLLHLTPSVLP